MNRIATSSSFPERETDPGGMSMRNRDTIAAISTAVAPSGIGIVRLSGPEAVAVADRVFRAKNGRPLAEAASHTGHYGTVWTNTEPDGPEAGAGPALSADAECLDEVLAAVYRAPRTYTREDVVEISCHGGVLVLRRVLEALLLSGARLAEPGEFTKRAFLNGRIGLSQAEAVMDLIGSRNASAARSALSHLGGALQRKIGALRERILHETAYIEAALDDPEHFDLTGYGAELDGTLADIQKETDALIATATEGRFVREGVATVILGRPNVGKSTLLNLLSGEERAIVTEQAGTTRDVLEEQVVLNGIPLRIMDTAGLRESGDAVEQIGVRRARACAEEADLILYLADGTGPASEEDRKILAELRGRTVILIRSKGDLELRVTEQELQEMLPEAPVLTLSAREGRGVEALAACIRDLFFHGKVRTDEEVYITNIRHKEALLEARESLSLTRQAIADRMPEDLYTVDLMDAYAALGRIVGAEVGEDLIDRIFSEFCMGK